MIMRGLRRFVPAPLLSGYHWSIAVASSVLHGAPSKRLIVIGVTGTKGKSSTTEYLAAMFEAAGKKIALNNSIHTRIGANDLPGSGRSMPGRGALQRLLAQAIRARCDVAIIEMTSEGARQHRHRGIAMDCLIFLNLAPEHIESHGSLERYADAKFELGKQLMRSPKRPRVMVANANDPQSARYLALPVEQALPFSLEKHSPYEARQRGGFFTFENERIEVALPGKFSLENALAAAHAARAFGVSVDAIKRGAAALTRIPGRAEEINAGQDFTVVVDYAHTPESLKALCDAYGSQRKICVLGSAGGGRDTWKRPVMAKTAEENCAHVILTSDDPYDEDPLAIIRAMEVGIAQPHETIPDRREAIRAAIAYARAGDAVLITGKGIDPIYGPGGTVIPWNDAEVAREEIARLLGSHV